MTHSVVVAHGTFDLLHPGHIAYLDFAKSHGDRLVVCLASDEMAQHSKGQQRPIQGFASRKRVLEALANVDEVVEVHMLTPDSGINIIEELKILRPTVFVSSYPEFEQNFGKEFKELGVTFILAPNFPGGTTTKLVERIISRYGKTAT